MFLRDHPLSTYRGVLAGHPLGRGRGARTTNIQEGKIGILKDVLPSNIEPADRCVLYIDHLGASYIGCLQIDHHVFCRQVVDLLLANRNRPIVEIGNLDVSHSL
jgi:hypothetical protein